MYNKIIIPQLLPYIRDPLSNMVVLTSKEGQDSKISRY